MYAWFKSIILPSEVTFLVERALETEFRTKNETNDKDCLKLYKFYTVHCSIIANENQQNAQIILIFSVCSTYLFQSCLTIIRVRCCRVSNTMTCAFVQGAPTRPPHSAQSSTQDILNIYTQLLNFLTLIINTPHDVWIVENIFITNYSLDECTYCCSTYSVTAHPDDGQARLKHVGATNWENKYHLCILLVFSSKG
jgi:hypothetical protein